MPSTAPLSCVRTYVNFVMCCRRQSPKTRYVRTYVEFVLRLRHQFRVSGIMSLMPETMPETAKWCRRHNAGDERATCARSPAHYWGLLWGLPWGLPQLFCPFVHFLSICPNFLSICPQRTNGQKNFKQNFSGSWGNQNVNRFMNRFSEGLWNFSTFPHNRSPWRHTWQKFSTPCFNFCENFFWWGVPRGVPRLVPTEISKKNSRWLREQKSEPVQNQFSEGL